MEAHFNAEKGNFDIKSFIMKPIDMDKYINAVVENSIQKNVDEVRLYVLETMLRCKLSSPGSSDEDSSSDSSSSDEDADPETENRYEDGDPVKIKEFLKEYCGVLTKVGVCRNTINCDTHSRVMKERIRKILFEILEPCKPNYDDDDDAINE